jgi:hypothetical protein
MNKKPKSRIVNNVLSQKNESLPTRSKSLPRITMYTWPSCIGLLYIKITF